MRGEQSGAEAWRKMVLRSMPWPAWLGPDAPQGDVVISSRFRSARNVAGHRFPGRASGSELRDIQTQLIEACSALTPKLDVKKTMSDAERDYLLGSRLISPEYEWTSPTSSLLLDHERMVSIMINEEDHMRLQALTPGLSIQEAEDVGLGMLEQLDSRIDFARDDEFGWLTSSPANAGSGRRRSALFHLIALAHTKRLATVVKALTDMGFFVRGLYGESSRAIGAFFQVSSIEGSLPEFRGACEYLIKEERRARREIPRAEIRSRISQARDFALASREISMADALRILAWVRWAAQAGVAYDNQPHRMIDVWTATLELLGTTDAKQAARHRADFLRTRLEQPLSETEGGGNA